MVWRRELGVLAVNWADILDGEIVNAAWAVAGMVARPRASRRVAANLDTAAWADTERLIRDALAGIATDSTLPELTEDEAAELAAAVHRPEVQGALQALLAVRLTDAPETDAARAREGVRLALATPPTWSPSFTYDELLTAGLLRAKQVSAERAAREAGLYQSSEDSRDLPVAGDEAGDEDASVAEPLSIRYSSPLSEYFDEKISALVATLEGQVGFAGLAQVRAEAYNARIVALLCAIERQVAALADPGRHTRAEAEFLHRYRRQAHLRHGFLTPPDFDRRRRVPVADIYVPTGISEADDPERMRLAPDTEPAYLRVWDLAGRLDRTVLLGDPGGGKTTAANVLTDHFAGDGSPRVAFLVTLREYAARTPIEWSVAEHIEHNLKTLYQSPAPDGLVERLLLTGRAVVILDGLDELLDTSRRREVSDRVEQFCSAYPLTPVLVTSRVVGYDQARLDDTQFSCYRLGGFGDEQVTEYAGKWFRSQEGLAPAEAAAKAEEFLAESANAKDLRANPLLLSLMCILYRGAGSLPGDRADIYARCAELLLRKWDEQRDLYRKLGSDHLVEPTLRFLAWWLFTRGDSQTAATERALIAKAAEFLYERGYETQEQARTAAREFIEFCRGRMWVFSDAGTTADGEKLYGFTHRTFLEYFTAWHLAVISDSPEELARTLAPRIAANEWTAVTELAIKIKSDASDRGADRVYATLLDHGLSSSDLEALLEFLATLLPIARPAPATVRWLTRAALDYAISWTPKVYLGLDPLESLLACGKGYRDLVGEEMSSRIASLIASDDAQSRVDGLRLTVSMPLPGATRDGFWRGWAREHRQLYAAEIPAAAVGDEDLRVLGLYADALTAQDAIAMPGGLTVLATVSPTVIQTRTSTGISRDVRRPYAIRLARALLDTTADVKEIRGITAIGEYLITHMELPWVRDRSRYDGGLGRFSWQLLAHPEGFPVLDPVGNLGMAAVLCIALELDRTDMRALPQRWQVAVEPSHENMRRLAGYIASRFGAETGELPDLSLPAGFGQLFRDWAARRINFVGGKGVQ